MDHTALSKSLASILRYNEYGLENKDGFFDIDDILSKLLNYTKEDIISLVNTDTVKRFKLSEDNNKIKAVYGHGDGNNPGVLIKDSSVRIIYYTNRSPKTIMKRGITINPNNEKVTGKFIYFNTNYDHSFDHKFVINTIRAMRDGFTFYSLENGNIISKGKNGIIPPEYIAEYEHF